MKTIAYMRVSTDEQKLGVCAQRDEIEKYAKTNGLEIISWHVDDGLSGAYGIEQRPGLAAALAELELYQGSVLLIQKRDRLARDRLTAAIVDRIVSKNGSIIRMADGLAYDQSPESKLIRGIMDDFAQYEREIIKQRTRIALAVKKRKGERCGGPAPFGYQWDGEKKVPNEHEQITVKLILNMRIEKKTYQEIADELNINDMMSRRGKWHVNSVKRIVDAHQKDA